MYRIIYNWIILHFIRLGLREKHISCHYSPRRSSPVQRHIFHATYQYKTSIFDEMHLTIASI